MTEAPAALVRRIVASRFPHASLDDREYVAGEVFLHLKHVPDVAACAHNQCNAYWRARYPAQHRAMNRLLYLIEHSTQFKLWDGGDHGLVCGRSAWQGRPPVKAVPGLFEFPSGEPDKQLAAVFGLMEGPVPLQQLAAVYAVLWDLREATGLELVKEPVIASVREMSQLWTEIAQLPLQQRIVVLFRLRDPQGDSALWLLHMAGVAWMTEIAGLLGMPPIELAELWSKLPLSDVQISERLAITGEEVIHLRHAALQTLCGI